MSRVKKLKESRSSVGVKFLYIFLIPLFISTIVSLFSREYLELLFKTISFFLIYISIQSIEKGLLEERRYKSSKLAKAPKIKYKLLGFTGVTLSLFILETFVNKSSTIETIINPLLGFIGFLIFYGSDPLKDKIPDSTVTNMDRVLDAILDAEKKIADIEKLEEKIDDYKLKVAINGAIFKAKEILNSIKEEPKEYHKVRKFMVVYLDGVKDVIEKYSEIDKTLLDDSYRDRLVDLLNSATLKFEEELQKLKSEELFDLDVQIDSLKRQFQE
jgi:5-bromo-4-chloroindolyl phosphate hydrolysis protein